MTSYTSSSTKLSETEQHKYQARFPILCQFSCEDPFAILSISQNVFKRVEETAHCSSTLIWQEAYKRSIFSPLSSIAPWVQIVCNAFKSSPAIDIRLELSTNDGFSPVAQKIVWTSAIDER